MRKTRDSARARARTCLKVLPPAEADEHDGQLGDEIARKRPFHQFQPRRRLHIARQAAIGDAKHADIRADDGKGDPPKGIRQHKVEDPAPVSEGRCADGDINAAREIIDVEIIFYSFFCWKESKSSCH